MRIILVQEKNRIQVLEGKHNTDELSLRSLLNAGELKYYELDYQENEGTSVTGYVAALNMFPEMLELSSLIRPI